MTMETYGRWPRGSSSPVSSRLSTGTSCWIVNAPTEPGLILFVHAQLRHAKNIQKLELLLARLNAPTTKFVPACQECPFFGVGLGTNAMSDFWRMSGLTCSHRWWVLWQSHSSTNTSWTHRICHTRKLSSQFCECRALLLEKGSERKLFLRVFNEDQRHLFSRHCSFAISTARDFCLFLTSILHKFKP